MGLYQAIPDLQQRYRVTPNYVASTRINVGTKWKYFGKWLVHVQHNIIPVVRHRSNKKYV